MNRRRINITSKRKTVKYNAEAQTIKLTKNIWETFVVGEPTKFIRCNMQKCFNLRLV